MTDAGVMDALCVRVEHHRRLTAWVLVGVLLIAASISGRIFCMISLLCACIIRSEERRLAAIFGAPYLD